MSDMFDISDLCLIISGDFFNANLRDTLYSKEFLSLSMMTDMYLLDHCMNYYNGDIMHTFGNETRDVYLCIDTILIPYPVAGESDVIIVDIIDDIDNLSDHLVASCLSFDDASPNASHVDNVLLFECLHIDCNENNYFLKYCWIDDATQLYYINTGNMLQANNEGYSKSLYNINLNGVNNLYEDIL